LPRRERCAPPRGQSERSASPEQRWGDLTERLLDYVARNPGRRGEHIAAKIGTDTTTIRLPMKKLIAAGKVRTTGQRRGMAYFAT